MSGEEFLWGSAILNAVLALALLWGWAKHRRELLSEKSATFAGCLGALSAGLALRDFDRRFEQAALALSSMRGGLDKEEIRWRLVRAALFRVSRVEPTLADIGGEHVRELALEVMNSSSTADEAWEVLDRLLQGDDDAIVGLRERYSEADIARAQHELEAGILRMYRAALQSRPGTEHA